MTEIIWLLKGRDGKYAKYQTEALAQAAAEESGNPFVPEAFCVPDGNELPPRMMQGYAPICPHCNAVHQLGTPHTCDTAKS